jgi:hypothetical protein
MVGRGLLNMLERVAITQSFLISFNLQDLACLYSLLQFKR